MFEICPCPDGQFTVLALPDDNDMRNVRVVTAGRVRSIADGASLASATRFGRYEAKRIAAQLNKEESNA